MRKKFKKTLKEISEEVVEIVNNESSDYDAQEKVLEHLAYYMHVSKDWAMSMDIDYNKIN